MAHPSPAQNSIESAPPRLSLSAIVTLMLLLPSVNAKVGNCNPRAGNNAGHNAVYTVDRHTIAISEYERGPRDSLGGRGENSAFLREDFR